MGKVWEREGPLWLRTCSSNIVLVNKKIIVHLANGWFHVVAFSVVIVRIRTVQELEMFVRSQGFLHHWLVSIIDNNKKSAIGTLE